MGIILLSRKFRTGDISDLLRVSEQGRNPDPLTPDQCPSCLVAWYGSQPWTYSWWRVVEVKYPRTSEAKGSSQSLFILGENEVQRRES